MTGLEARRPAASSRHVERLLHNWRFSYERDVRPEDRVFGNVQIIANETSLWQKAGNHGLSRAGNSSVRAWRSVRLPHDYSLEGEFTSEVDASVGAMRRAPAVYVRDFELRSPRADERIRLEFDGVFRNSQVFVNGHFVGRHLSGYTSFSFDVTELCTPENTNTVAVHVDPTDNELWSYEGAGIYREVRLVRTHNIFLDFNGVRVVSRADGSATVTARVRNMRYDAVRAAIRCTVRDAAGVQVCVAESATVSIDDVESCDVEEHLEVADVNLWSPASPYLYQVSVEVMVAGNAVDCVDTLVGFRDVVFDAAEGFFINGDPLKLKGVCLHQDHAGVGVAVPPRLQEWRLVQLKEMGCNAVRMSHNPPDPALLDACDRLGLLVVNEVRIPGIAEELLRQAEDLVKRDRNHPSVILWSIGNEEMQLHGNQVGANVLKRMRRAIEKLDDRPTTYAMNQQWADLVDFHAADGPFVDVFGSNYRSGQVSANYDEVHARYPDWPMVATETFGGVATRGLYTPDRGSNLPIQIGERWNTSANFPDPRYPLTASAYGHTYTPWGYSIEETWRDCARRPFLAGTFIWTGFDYRGETFPYDWPSVVSRFGLLDYCGIPKEIAHYLRAWWRPQDPHTFLMPHWTWPGREGEEIDVRCYTNAARVILQRNGTTVFEATVKTNDRVDAAIVYEPGELIAIGLDDDGKEVSRDSRSTVSKATQIELVPSRKLLAADGADCIVVLARVVDEAGRLHPLSDEDLTFTIEGNIELIGVGNGDPNSHESDLVPRRRVFHGIAALMIRAKNSPGLARITATGWGLQPGTFQFEIVSDADPRDLVTETTTWDSVNEVLRTAE